jgi:hypothetical protein
MAKGNRRLRSVVEGAMDATKEARRAAAAEKIRQSAATAPAAQPPAPEPAPAPKKPRRTRPTKTETEIEPDTRLEANAEQRVPVVAPEPPTMSADEAKQLRDTMLQSSRPKKRTTPKPKTEAPKPSPSGFAPIRGPGALLGRLLKETYRQAPNIAANAVAIPAFTAAGAGGAYLGTAATVGAMRAIGKLLSPQEEASKEPAPLPTPKSVPDDYRSGFQRAIEERRKARPTSSGSNVIRSLTRGIS